jgi:hypothetical protein
MEDLSICAIDCGSHDVDGHGQYRRSFMVYAVVVVVHIHLCHPLAQTTISVLSVFFHIFLSPIPSTSPVSGTGRSLPLSLDHSVVSLLAIVVGSS